MCLHAAKNEEINGIIPYQKFFMSCYITFKKKTSTCGSYPDCSVGQWVNKCDPLSTLVGCHEYGNEQHINIVGAPYSLGKLACKDLEILPDHYLSPPHTIKGGTSTM